MNTFKILDLKFAALKALFLNTYTVDEMATLILVDYFSQVYVSIKEYIV